MQKPMTPTRPVASLRSASAARAASMASNAAPERFERALADAGVEHDIHVYPGAPHSFFDRKYDEFAAECEDAWRRVLDFLQTIGAPA